MAWLNVSLGREKFIGKRVMRLNTFRVIHATFIESETVKGYSAIRGRNGIENRKGE